MGLLNRLFKGRDTEEAGEEYGEYEEYEDVPQAYAAPEAPRSELNIDDPAQRREYVENCLQRMSEGARQIDALRAEYAEVTGCLHDMDELRALPEEEHKRLEAYAVKIRESEARREEFLRRESKMTDAEYTRVESLGREAAAAVRRFADAEDYHRKVKSDLRRLDNEREAYLIREEDLTRTIASTHFLSIACMAMLIVLIVLLFILHMTLGINVTYGYMLAVLFSAAAIVWLYVRNSGADKELRQVENALNRLIMLQNTVKIRYVNNRNLLDYYILKYGTDHSEDLKNLIEQYKGERKLREKYQDEQERMSRLRSDLVRTLRDYRIRYPEEWTHRTDALLDPETEAEQRKALLKRRQQLRSRMDYNQDVVIDKAREEIRLLAEHFPQYADEITSIVDTYTASAGEAT